MARELVVNVVDERWPDRLEISPQERQRGNVVYVYVTRNMTLGQITDKIIREVKAKGGEPGSISLMRFYGHGNAGYLQFGMNIYEWNADQLKKLTEWMTPGSYGLELHGCNVGSAVVAPGLCPRPGRFYTTKPRSRPLGWQMLTALKDVLQVPVTAGIECQYTDQLHRFEGPTITVSPDGVTLRDQPLHTFDDRVKSNLSRIRPSSYLVEQPIALPERGDRRIGLVTQPRLIVHNPLTPRLAGSLIKLPQYGDKRITLQTSPKLILQNPSFPVVADLQSKLSQLGHKRIALSTSAKLTSGNTSNSGWGDRQDDAWRPKITDQPIRLPRPGDRRIAIQTSPHLVVQNPLSLKLVRQPIRLPQRWDKRITLQTSPQLRIQHPFQPSLPGQFKVPQPGDRRISLQTSPKLTFENRVPSGWSDSHIGSWRPKPTETRIRFPQPGDRQIRLQTSPHLTFQDPLRVRLAGQQIRPPLYGDRRITLQTSPQLRLENAFRPSFADQIHLPRFGDKRITLQTSPGLGF